MIGSKAWAEISSAFPEAHILNLLKIVSSFTGQAANSRRAAETSNSQPVTAKLSFQMQGVFEVFAQLLYGKRKPFIRNFYVALRFGRFDI
ncbi:MAG: hypothetical protein L0312_32235 [Acidobacteria bacterium]|nr:hypothetical protein [Acidobacteriota bacterium]